MTLQLLLPAVMGLLPVMAFLLVLVYFDSYKLAAFTTVLWVLAAGAASAAACYYLNGFLLQQSGLPFPAYSHWVAPFVEEGLKALVILWLFRSHRIGFIADAAVFGFAVGAGFAVFENLFYLMQAEHRSLLVWFVRGFGTAFMHGGTVAVFAVLLVSLADRHAKFSVLQAVPGLLLAAAVHSVFNHFLVKPMFQTLLMLVILLPLLYTIFQRSQRLVAEWLGEGFDAGVETLTLIHSGQLSGSPIGQYVHTLKARFNGEVLTDILCYLRLHVELALRAKGMLLMREEGFEVPLDAETRDKLIELGHLSRSIGKTGLAAIAPMLASGRKDLWQLQQLRD